MNDRIDLEEKENLVKFWKLVTLDLDKPWKLDLPEMAKRMPEGENLWSFTAILTNGPITLWATNRTYSHPHMWHIHQSLPHDSAGKSNLSYKTAIPSINLSDIKSPKAIAAGIRQRLLGDAEAMARENARLNEAADAFRNGREMAVREVAASILGRLNGRLFSDNEFEFYPMGINEVNVVKPSGDSEVRFTVTCSPKKAIRVLKLLQEKS